MNKLLLKKRANTTIEFSLFITVVIFAIIGMQAYLKRGIEGGWHRQIDQMASQFSFEYGNVTTIAIESANNTETQSNGIIRVEVSQSVVRISDEEIEPTDVESQIGI